MAESGVMTITGQMATANRVGDEILLLADRGSDVERYR